MNEVLDIIIAKAKSADAEDASRLRGVGENLRYLQGITRCHWPEKPEFNCPLLCNDLEKFSQDSHSMIWYCYVEHHMLDVNWLVFILTSENFELTNLLARAVLPTLQSPTRTTLQSNLCSIALPMTIFGWFQQRLTLDRREVEITLLRVVDTACSAGGERIGTGLR